MSGGRVPHCLPRPHTAYALRKWPANCLLTVFKLPLNTIKEYNNESIMDFTIRSFKEVSGETATSQGEKIIPHACLSHVMKDAKNDFKKV